MEHLPLRFSYKVDRIKGVKGEWYTVTDKKTKQIVSCVNSLGDAEMIADALSARRQAERERAWNRKKAKRAAPLNK
jgi:hypothetical protein